MFVLLGFCMVAALISPPRALAGMAATRTIPELYQDLTRVPGLQAAHSQVDATPANAMAIAASATRIETLVKIHDPAIFDSPDATLQAFAALADDPGLLYVLDIDASYPIADLRALDSTSGRSNAVAPTASQPAATCTSEKCLVNDVFVTVGIVSSTVGVATSCTAEIIVANVAGAVLCGISAAGLLASVYGLGPGPDSANRIGSSIKELCLEDTCSSDGYIYNDAPVLTGTITEYYTVVERPSTYGYSACQGQYCQATVTPMQTTQAHYTYRVQSYVNPSSNVNPRGSDMECGGLGEFYAFWYDTDSGWQSYQTTLVKGAGLGVQNCHLT